MPRCQLFACLLFAVSWIPQASAQQSLGSIAGKVTDPQGRSIPAAAVTVTNTETNSARHAVTDETGYYEVSLLNPGVYSVAAEAPGFKKALRGGLTLNVASRLDLDLQLQIGQATEIVEVTSEAPLLETSKASGGRVIDNHQIMQLPFSDMNPFALATLAAGMQWTGQPEYRRPFDNGGTSSFNTAGGVGSNEYTIDGAPATGTGRRVGYVPPSDAVDEFKLETSSFDASYGHSSGATINVSTKSGTNTYHGSLYDQHWQQRWNATQHFSRLAFNDAVRQGKTRPDAQRQAPGRSNNFGGTLGGPIRIPKVYNGRDKLFFFFSYNGIYQSKAETTDSVNRSVPKLAWRQGDFSDLLAIDPVKYTIYDPRTARLVNGRVVRDPFPGNKGIPVLNPMYDFYAKLYPAPNNVPGLVTPEGTNNYLATALPKNEKFNSLINRVDYNISDRHRVFGRWYWNHRLADEYDWTYETARGLHTNGLTRINKGIGGDYIWTINNRNIVDFGVNATRFNEGSQSPLRTQYKAADVKLPAYIDQKAGDLHELPRISFSNLESVGDSYPAITTRGTVGETKAQVTSILGRHSMKYGFEERRYWFTSAGPGNTAGNYTFNNNFTKAADNTTTASNTGLEWAAFMMGLPSGISIDTNDSAYWKTPWRSLYLQDEWRIHSRATLSLGLRFEHEGGTSERFNRGLAGGFDFTSKLPFTDAVQAAYAASPLSELPASQFQVLGGSYYLGESGKTTWTNGVNHFMPRIGLVYSLNDKTVIRTGYGTYYDSFNVTNDRPGQDGFSQATGTTLTNDQGLTFCCGVGAAASLAQGRTPLADPFPVRTDGTRFDSPYGNKIGPLIRFGRGFSYVPREYSPAGQQRWRFGVQREIRKDMVVEVSYNGAFARIPVNQRIDYLPSKYWATGNTRNQAVDDDLNTNVPNPFNIKNYPDMQNSNPVLYKYLGTQGFFTSSTIR
ncbi:MAG TPA: carboxypeptidase-like regulatory domain-containing protein, partial [Bryobacteraceae bacterium]|nr:carboxypeptidase-like regulatory domain-containing protein [Bryobacteraceae bacterium]